MNKERRTAIEKLVGQLADIRSELETLRDAEQEAFDNMPEGLQSSERGQASEEAANTLDAQISAIEETETELQGVADA